jgi:glutaredoxin 3
MENITIYTQNTCGYCKTIKDELVKNNLKFKEKLTTEHSTEWNNIVGLTGMPTTPTIYYKGNYFVPGRDFGNAENLINIIKNYKQSEFQMPFQVLEKVKTMNYNMATAFQRLDQLLRTIEQKIDKL